MAEQRKFKELFSLPTGNNDHWAGGLLAGFSIDYADTVQIAFEAGFTKFSEETYYNFPVPTHQFQQGIFPRKANINVEPGTNWTFGASIHAYHFLDRLSTYIEFRMVQHTEDCIKLVQPVAVPTISTSPITSDDVPCRDVIRIDELIERSKWESHFVNAALNYDISENLALGFLWQAPVKQRNAYKSTTIMGSLIVTY
jgi:hypothetical protein